MRWLWLVICIALAGCGTAPQPESHRTVAAYEIPLPTERERGELLIILRREAAAEGLHVDAASVEDLAVIARDIPDATMTINATVWRGPGDDQPEATIMDHHDHLGQVWIMFGKGVDSELARRFRDRAMQRILKRWPETLSLPILPTGSIPLHRDLRRTPQGYEVDPAAASNYESSPSRPVTGRH